MKTIIGQSSSLDTTEADVLTVAITPPTAARLHGIVSSSVEDTNTAVAQVETATVVGTVTGSGNATVIVTSAGTPKTVSVAVLDEDTADEVATKVRDALIADAAIGHLTTGKFDVKGAAAEVILTANVIAANDTTLNVDINNGTSTGLTDAPTSANTTAGAVGSGALSVLIKGLDNDYKSIQETVYLEGTSSVNTTLSYRFINEMTIGSGEANVGAITATAATDETKTCTITALDGKSQQAIFMVSDNGQAADIYFKNLYADSYNATTTAYTNLKIKTKLAGGTWMVQRAFKLDNVKVSLDYDFVGFILPSRSLVKITGTASAGTGIVNVAMGIE